jgi:hypothetical protein
MIAYLAGEPGARVVGSLLTYADATALSFCKVFSDLLRRTDELQARQTIDDLHAAGVRNAAI